MGGTQGQDQRQAQGHIRISEEGRIMSGVRDGLTLGSVSESVGWRSEAEDGFIRRVRERPTVVRRQAQDQTEVQGGNWSLQRSGRGHMRHQREKVTSCLVMVTFQ